MSKITLSCLHPSHTPWIFFWVLYCSQHILVQKTEMRPCRQKTTISVIFIGCHKVTEEHVPHFTYLMTKQQRLGVKLFAALMAGQFGGIACPALCRFHGVASLGLSWHRGGRDGRVGRHKWGHWGMTGMMAWIGDWGWVILRDRRDWAGSGRGPRFRGISDGGVPERGGSIG